MPADRGTTTSAHSFKSLWTRYMLKEWKIIAFTLKGRQRKFRWLILTSSPQWEAIFISIDKLIDSCCKRSRFLIFQNCNTCIIVSLILEILCPSLSPVDLRGARHLLTSQHSLPGIPVSLKQSIDLRTSMDGKYKEIAEVSFNHCAPLFTR